MRDLPSPTPPQNPIHGFSFILTNNLKGNFILTVKVIYPSTAFFGPGPMYTRTLLLPSLSSLVSLRIHVRGLNRMHFTEPYGTSLLKGITVSPKLPLTWAAPTPPPSSRTDYISQVICYSTVCSMQCCGSGSESGSGSTGSTCVCASRIRIH